ncbi:hypothetical protein EVAR_35540_1 [Eumeta japonica]|uniref:Uncharacterized protein n=1 Tax=Eumeta variegata TaxID=151549 RepID=A0A4C1X4V4_EUMVA|nr:hypothetical protein EVAR_35540_1 [Eumeta japonica]
MQGHLEDYSTKRTCQSCHNHSGQWADVKEVQTFINENFTPAMITAGKCRIGIILVYFEGDKPIGSYLDRVKWVCYKLGKTKLSYRVIVMYASYAWAPTANNLSVRKMFNAL